MGKKEGVTDARRRLKNPSRRKNSNYVERRASPAFLGKKQGALQKDGKWKKLVFRRNRFQKGVKKGAT